MRQPDRHGPTLVVRHTGQSFPLAQGPVTLGRDQDNIIVLSDSQASRHHASISYRSGTYVIQDLKSANGTFVNERRVAGTRALRKGDSVRIGSTVLDVRFPPGADPDATLDGQVAPAWGGQVQRTDDKSVAPGRRGSPWLAVVVGLLAVAIVVTAVAFVLLFLRPGQGKDGPAVTLLSPVAGSQVNPGSQVPLEARATGRALVRLELLVDGTLVAIATSPEAAGADSLSVSAFWVLSQPGMHVVSARALTAGGESSDPVSVSLIVLEAVGQASASPGPSATGEGPTVESPTTEAPTAQSPTSELPPPEPPTVEPTHTPSPTPSSTPSPTTEPASGGTTGGGQSRPAGPGPITGFEDFGTWKRGDQPNGTFTQSTEQVHSGTYSGKLDYSFPSGSNDFVVFLQTHKLGGEPNQVSAWVYGDGSKHYLNIWIQDAAGEMWQFPLGQVKHVGWQQMFATLNPGGAWPAGHISGPSNGTIDYPIDFRGFVLDDVPDSYTGSGSIYLDDLRCDKASAPPPTPTPTATTRPAATPAPIIQFWADDTDISAGSATFLRWHVENVTAIYLEGEPVTGPDGSKKVRPAATTTYRLRVLYPGGEEIRTVTIVVN